MLIMVTKRESRFNISILHEKSKMEMIVFLIIVCLIMSDDGFREMLIDEFLHGEISEF